MEADGTRSKQHVLFNGSKFMVLQYYFVRTSSIACY
jgi:hypothetical protein